MIKKISLAILSFSLLVQTGCKNDTENDREYFFNLDSYFTIEEGTVSGQTYPSASDSSARPSITSITGNSIIPSGGKHALNIETNEPVIRAFVGVLKENSGYYILNFDEPQQSFSITPDFIAEPKDNVYFLKVAVEDEDDFVSDYDTLKVVTLDAVLGDLEISLTWDQEVDLDLYLIEPNGDTIYYDNPVSGLNAWLNHDSNPFCWIDSLKEETITYDVNSAIQTGTYHVLLRYFSNCASTESVNYTIEVKYNNQLLEQAGWTNPNTGTLTDEDISALPEKIFSFTVNESLANSVSQSVVSYSKQKAKSLSPEKSAWEKKRK